MWDTYRGLRESQRWTVAGARFVALMGTSCGLWQSERVPADIAALAAEAVVDHRVRWRLHHLRPDPDEVSELADGMLRDEAGPWRPRTVSALRPDATARSLATGMALIRRAAVAPSRWCDDVPGHHQEATNPARSVPAEALASDTARLLGDIALARSRSVSAVTADPSLPAPWVSLALALRSTDAGSESEARCAARALSHRPELVRAVCAAVRARAETAPDPVALAARIDPPHAGVDPPPVYRP
ncbi:hypothetical protein ADK57_10240 [Streptomyces sp. MMG1533]|uniref:hypothetical protein n=1 Tax=Streptomyces sp. MMG1533 TaxID=1415546 RepID=UPI0006ADCC93|nr:hypothetical protein [Streptomyces sp. MMG1533]KOU72314.1 hypothetical protein ADK57_10240 [Streptomyces sp. MMG1533]